MRNSIGVAMAIVIVILAGLLVYLDSEYTKLQQENIELQIEHDWAVEFSKLTDEQKQKMLELIRKQIDV